MRMINTLKRLVNLFAILALTYPVAAQAATQSSYPTKTSPVDGDKALITDSADGNKTKQATVSSLPISTATQAALNSKANSSAFASQAAFTSAWGWTPGISYTLPTATSDILGGIKVGSRLTITNGVLSADVQSGTGAVDSVNSQTGVVVLDADDISDTSTTKKFVTAADLTKLGNTSGTNTGDQDLSVYLSKTNTTAFTPTADYHPATKKYVDDSITAGGGYTDEQAQDAVGGMFSGNTETGITVTYDDATGKVNFVVTTVPMTYPSANNFGWTTNGTSWSPMGLDTDLSTVSASDDTIPSAKATKAALDLKTNASNIAFEAGSLSDLKILDSTHTTSGTGTSLVQDSMAYGNADDAYHLWTIDKIGSELAGKLSTTGIDTSAELRTILTDETGTGALVFSGGDIGAATATTPSANDNDTSVSTTAYVQAELAAYASDTVTFTNKTLSSFELGSAATDTTVTRASAGVIAVEGITVTRTIASGTAALGTTAISSGACATAVTATATGAATTDVINWGFNGDPTAVTGYVASANGMLTIIAYPSANNVNFKVCNNTSASITPGAITLNWQVAR